jgi:hypothetical protein
MRLWLELARRCSGRCPLLLVRGIKRRSMTVPGHLPLPPQRGLRRPTPPRVLLGQSLLPHPTRLRLQLRLCSHMGHPLLISFGAGSGGWPPEGWGNWPGHEEPLMLLSGNVLATTSKPSSPISTAKRHLFPLLCCCAVHRLILAPCSVHRLILYTSVML